MRAIAAPLLAAAAILALAACTPQQSGPQSSRDSVQQRFVQHMDGCSARHGYDPSKTTSLGPHQLGENERDWSDCIYDGIRRYLAVNSPVPDAYAALIETHKSLTNQVEAGQITRDQRRAEVEALFESIRRDEDALLQEQASKQRATSDQRTQREIERIRRDVDQTRRTLLNSM